MTGNRKVTLFNLISEDGTVVMYNVTAVTIADELGVTVSYIYSRSKTGRPVGGRYYVFNDEEYDGIDDHSVLYTKDALREFKREWTDVTAQISERIDTEKSNELQRNITQSI